MNRGTVAFVSSMGLLLPAAWSTIGADREDVLNLTRPGAPELAVDKNTTVKVSSDRAIYAPGDKMSAVLVATSTVPHDVTVNVQITEQSGQMGERVQNPDRVVTSNHITLAARPGGGPAKSISVELPGFGTPKTDAQAAAQAGRTRQYTIHVTKNVADEDSGAEAMLSVVTRNPEAFSVSIESPADVQANAPFTATVVVRNTSGRTLKYVNVGLAPAPTTIGGGMGMPLFPGSDDKLSISEVDATVDTLAPGQAKTFKYEVTPDEGFQKGGLYAFASANNGGSALDMKQIFAIPTGSTVALK
jgi:hypothetical protein